MFAQVVRFCIPVAVAASCVPAVADDALHRVTFVDDEKQTRTVDGRILVTAQDGGILLEGRDGILWNVTPQQLKHNAKTGTTFTPFTQDELAKRLKAEFGAGFEVYRTRRYVICSNAGRHYSRWVGALFERLMTAFYKHWKSPQLKLREAEFPLIAVVFADRKQFAPYAAKDAGVTSTSTAGYYSARSNRVVLFDLTAGPRTRPARSVREVTRRVGRSPFTLSTVVHEATHQIAFNSGLHTRYADNPLWLTEGMAMYFESPDVHSAKGWNTVGKVNPFRIREFRKFLAGRRKAGSLKTLISSDGRLTDAKTAGDAYAEAWALTYFLIKTRRKDYQKYLAAIAAKPVLIFGGPDQRLKEFREAFGEPAELDRAFVQFFQKRRRR